MECKYTSAKLNTVLPSLNIIEPKWNVNNKALAQKLVNVIKHNRTKVECKYSYS